ncbi:hypothetical protein [Petroclostridium sp. X23]|uniref:hypothetical protein n=1 Tax=Petroclostridium sp. X23 TaxID=3045146 RepID=UPI0024AE764B|nr:hypothetical protein [Petroclostridium sp. X23]WHH57196.1 hypothetical protein QKW49_15265 [Petroclostridium sp. X23]
MAFDRVVLSTHVKHTDINITDWRYIDVKDIPVLKGAKSIKVDDCLHLSYYPYLPYGGSYPYLLRGTLFLSFSIPKLLKGDNIASIWAFNFQVLWEILCMRLSNILPKIYELSHIRFWSISKIEINFDLIDSAENIKRYYEVIGKMNVPRYNKLDEYEEDGTVYNVSGKDIGASNAIERIYLKKKERLDRKYIQRPSAYCWRRDLVNIDLGDAMLRFEMELHRPKIKYDLIHSKGLPRYNPYTCISVPDDRKKPTHILEQMFEESKKQRFMKRKDPSILFEKYNPDNNVAYIPYDSPLMPSGIGTFQDVCNYEIGIYYVKSFISKYHFDKIITTRKKLFSFINNSTEFSMTEKNRLKMVIDHLNDREKANCILSDKSINKYKHKILAMGYHYIYSDEELKPITIERILDSLPDEQKRAIEVNIDSDFFKDLQYKI